MTALELYHKLVDLSETGEIEVELSYEVSDPDSIYSPVKEYHKVTNVSYNKARKTLVLE